MTSSSCSIHLSTGGAQRQTVITFSFREIVGTCWTPTGRHSPCRLCPSSSNGFFISWFVLIFLVTDQKTVRSRRTHIYRPRRVETFTKNGADVRWRLEPMLGLANVQQQQQPSTIFFAFFFFSFRGQTSLCFVCWLLVISYSYYYCMSIREIWQSKRTCILCGERVWCWWTQMMNLAWEE